MNRILLLNLTLLIISCSSQVERPHPVDRQLLSFDVYDQSLETVLKIVASKYECDLDFNTVNTNQKWSLSVHNADIKDLLMEISAATGLYTDFSDKTIKVQESIEGLGKEITVKMNGNLWRDLRFAEVKQIDPLAVKSFFGPILRDSLVTDVDESAGTITLEVLPENEEFIRESLSLLNYSKQTRNLGISLFVVETKDKKMLEAANIPEENTKFSWGLNAGDNLNFKLKNDVEVSIKSTALSDFANLSSKKFELSFTYNGLNSTRVYDEIFDKRQVIKLKDDIYLLVKANWYINNKKVDSPVVTSDILLKKGYNDFNSLPETRILLNGIKTPLDWCAELSKKGTEVKYVQFSKSEDFKRTQVKIESGNLRQSIKQLCEQSSLNFTSHSNGLLIHSYSPLRQTFWTFTPKVSEEYAVIRGAFITEFNGEEVWLLPSAKAYLSDKPFKQVKQ